jgi:hypothetical protein
MHTVPRTFADTSRRAVSSSIIMFGARQWSISDESCFHALGCCCCCCCCCCNRWLHLRSSGRSATKSLRRVGRQTSQRSNGTYRRFKLRILTRDLRYTSLESEARSGELVFTAHRHITPDRCRPFEGKRHRRGAINSHPVDRIRNP